MSHWERAVVVLLGAATVILACEDPISHVFIAGQYNPKLDCVSPGLAIDVLNGPPTDVDASCDVTCVVPPFDAGVYASAQCAPFPPGDDTSGRNPQCGFATRALLRHDLCVEAGVSGPPGDASSPDASADAPSHDAQHLDVDAARPADGSAAQ